MKKKYKKIVEKLIGNEIEDRELKIYLFALKIMVLQAMPYLMITIISILRGRWVEHFLFITIYSVLRRYSGGFHFSKQSTCFITSMMLLYIFCEIGAVLPFTIMTGFVMFLMGIALILNSSMQYEVTYVKYKKCQGKVCKRLLLIFLLCLLLIALDKIEFVKWIGLGIVMTRVLQYPCLCMHLYAEKRHSS